MPPVVRIQPTNKFPLPYALDPQGEPATFAEELAVAGTTAEALRAMGAPIEVDATTLREEAALLRDAVQKKKTGALTKHLGSSLAAAAFLREYGKSMALDVVQVRTALTNKLLELADCGDARYELRAIELLGKHSDIGLFTERSEVTINYKDSTSLEEAIKTRVKRLLNAATIGPEDVHYAAFDADDEHPYTPFQEVPPDPDEPEPVEPDFLPPLPHDDWEDDPEEWEEGDV